MFIRKTKTGTLTDDSAKYSHRLVENIRVNDKIKQRTLLNLGANFDIERRYWKVLCRRVEELLLSQTYFEFVPPEKSIEAQAKRIANQLLQRQGRSLPEVAAKKDFHSVDVNSVVDAEVRTAGVEHAALEALESLGMSELLIDLGFSRRQRLCALANIVGRIAKPASERATNRWLRTTSALGEMLDMDFGALSDMALYRASDQLLKHHEKIEHHLFERAKSLFNFKATIAFYDLTNTYFEGQMNTMKDAKRGRSKEKRSDCPLLTLALVVDASGFVIKSRIFAGNVAECKTLETMIDELGGDADAVVVMDRGVADDANVKWLRDNGYRYVVVSREQHRQFQSDETETLITANHNKVHIYKEMSTQIDDEGDAYQEALLRCYSESRESKEAGIINRFRKRFEDALTNINESLGRPRARNKVETVQRRIGRIEKQNSRVARHYRIDVHYDESATRVKSLSWSYEPLEGSMATHPGVYCLRSNILNWDAQMMWRTYMTLSEVEAVFRSLKSEMGLRPVYHQKQHRANGHLLISVLAYQAVWLLRKRMKENGCHDSWTTVRAELCSITRTTTTMKCRSGRTLHLRKTAQADSDQAAIYKAMGISAPPRKLHKTVI